MKLAIFPPCIWNFNTNLSHFRPFLVERGCCMNLPPLTFLYYPTWCDVAWGRWLYNFGPNFSPRKHLGNCTGTKIFSQGVACSGHTERKWQWLQCFYFFWGGDRNEKAEGFPSQHPWGKFRSDNRVTCFSWYVDLKIEGKKGEGNS